jgi:hypothetical protein
MKHSLNYLFIYFFIAANFIFLTNAASQDFVVHQESDIGPLAVSNIDGVSWSSAIATNEENGNIYWAYISPDMKAVIARKDAQTGEVTTHVIHEKVKDDDNHAELSIGLDSDGYIHYLGNHHNSSPNYYISDNPDDISSWTFKGNDFENGGLQGIGITYQSFYRSLTGTLFVAYRSQVHNSAAKGTRSIALGKYDTSTKKWIMIGSLDYCFDGLDCKEHCGSDLGITAFVWDNSGSGGGSCLSYGNYGFYQGYKLIVAFDENNVMHCTWNLSKNVFTTSNPAEFHTHVMYACSPDEGDTWFRADGSQIKKLPITCDTGDDEQDGDVVFTKLPQGYPNTCDTPTEEWTMTNQGNIFPDSDGKPIISCTVLTRTGNFNATESHYLQWNGAEWQDITKDFNLRGNIFSNHDGIMFAFLEGQSSSFELYEDDGISQDYKKGKNALTKLEYSRKKDMHTIIINPTKGSYEGRLEKQSYKIELAASQKAKLAKINGKKVSVVYDKVKKTNTITIPESDINSKITVMYYVR